jgi:DNA-binding NtrC family response regulator
MPTPTAGQFARDRAAWERAYFAAALERYGTLKRAAAALGISRAHLHERVKRYGLKNPNAARRGQWGGLA